MIHLNHLDSSCKLNDSKNVTKLIPHVEFHAGFKRMWEARFMIPRFTIVFLESCPFYKCLLCNCLKHLRQFYGRLIVINCLYESTYFSLRCEQ